jgi:hypothetical protein
MATSPRCIIAYTAEDDRFRAVRQAAIETARESQAKLILYDFDAASTFSSPLPSNWSGEGADELFPELLGPEDLERAGRHRIAIQVIEARNKGVDAYGWLPDKKSGEELAEYAEKQAADLIMLPAELKDPGLFDRWRGASVEKAAEETGRPIAVVEEDGTVEYI